VSVHLVDAEPNGLASLLGDLLQQNLERNPALARDLRPASFSIEAADVGLAVTIRTDRGSVSITNGAHPSAEVAVRTDAITLLELSSAPLRLGLPDPMKREGRAVIGMLLRRRLRVRGLLRHPVKLGRLSRLLSAEET
jgi:hypothetical protein